MATTTSNFGWSVPQSSDLVKDGAVAIQTLGDAIDYRFGNSTSFPNQLVNQLGIAARPIPFAMSAGRVTFSGTSIAANASASATVTFATSTRFTVAPVVMVTKSNVTATSNSFEASMSTSATTGFTAIFVNSTAATASFTNVEMSYIAVQMTFASAINS